MVSNLLFAVFWLFIESKVTSIVFFSFIFIKEKLSNTWVLSSKSLGKCIKKSPTVVTQTFCNAWIYLSVVFKIDFVSFIGSIYIRYKYILFLFYKKTNLLQVSFIYFLYTIFFLK